VLVERAQPRAEGGDRARHRAGDPERDAEREQQRHERDDDDAAAPAGGGGHGVVDVGGGVALDGGEQRVPRRVDLRGQRAELVGVDRARAVTLLDRVDGLLARELERAGIELEEAGPGVDERAVRALQRRPGDQAGELLRGDLAAFVGLGDLLRERVLRLDVAVVDVEVVGGAVRDLDGVLDERGGELLGAQRVGAQALGRGLEPAHLREADGGHHDEADGECAERDAEPDGQLLIREEGHSEKDSASGKRWVERSTPSSVAPQAA
jgi:hypothetical protein